MEVLERRVLYSADPILSPLLDALITEPHEDNYSLPEDPFVVPDQRSSGTTVSELVIVDVSHSDLTGLYHSLAQQYDGTTTKVVTLDSSDNALKQVTELLDHYSSLDAIHLLSHGTDGELYLGGQSVTANELEDNAETVA